MTLPTRGGRLTAALLLAGALTPSGRAQTVPPAAAESWVSTWGAAASSPANDIFFAGTAYLGTNAFNNQTMRLVVHVSLGGRDLRVRLSNEQGTSPVVVGAAHVALATPNGGIDPTSDHVLTFNGAPAVTLGAGAPALSDPVKFTVANGSNLAISLYLPGSTTVTSGHPYAVQTSFVAPPNTGDTTGAAVLPLDPADPTINEWPLLGGVEVKASGAGTVVAFGASITAGFDTPMDANARWPDFLAQRFQKRGLPLAVVNPSITANRLLTDLQGVNALARFDRDVLARPGVQWVIVADTPGTEITGGASTAAEIITGLEQLAARAHGRNVKIIVATAVPIYDLFGYTPDSEAVRQTVNAFIRTTTLFDGVADFDAAVRDPDAPAQLNPAFDSGDHHHPNAAGQAALAVAVPMVLFK